MKRFRTIVDVHLFLIQKGKILLLKRQHTGYMDGYYHVPAGHLENGEMLVEALIRESKEELGIIIRPVDVRFVHVMHNRSDTPRIGFFFEVKRWSGVVINKEIFKCSELRWADLGHLPRRIVPYARKAIVCFRLGILFSQFGWN